MSLPDRVGDQVRIGVAITVPQPFGADLQRARIRSGDPQAHDIPPHVTLLGPTVVEQADLAAVIDHLGDVGRAHRPFTLDLSGTGTFRPVSAVVFVEVAQGRAECERLERAVRSGPLDRTLRFGYHPHVTVAHDVPDEDLDRAHREMAGYRASFSVTGFEVFEHGDDGVWRPVQRFVLGAGVAGEDVRTRG